MESEQLSYKAKKKYILKNLPSSEMFVLPHLPITVCGQHFSQIKDDSHLGSSCARDRSLEITACEGCRLRMAEFDKGQEGGVMVNYKVLLYFFYCILLTCRLVKITLFAIPPVDPLP